MCYEIFHGCPPQQYQRLPYAAKERSSSSDY